MDNRKYKPVKLIESLEGINYDLANKFGKIEYVIYSKWPQIVGEFFAEYSKPNKITKMPKLP